MGNTPVKTKRPAAQVEPSKKAAAVKAATKPPQRPWLRDLTRQLPPLSDAPVTPKRLSAANQPQAPPRLLSKAEVCTIVGVSFPTVWSWMRAAAFPRSRVVWGKSMWLLSEIDAWLAALPVRPLKGDAPTEAA